MTEKLLTEYFDKNFADISSRVKKSAEESGRRAEDITVLAATKTVSPALINYAIENGIKYIGENKVQEFLSKEDAVNKNVHKHFIGHLQSNKVKDIVGKVELIQSVHSVKLASVIGKESVKKDIISDILLEINIGKEESKSGFTTEEIYDAIEEIEKIEGVKIRGLMCIPPICTDKIQNREYFVKMYQLFVDIKAKKGDNDIVYLSMGMSDDFDTAILCGANMVRIGTALFGKRNYNI